MYLNIDILPCVHLYMMCRLNLCYKHNGKHILFWSGKFSGSQQMLQPWDVCLSVSERPLKTKCPDDPRNVRYIRTPANFPGSNRQNKVLLRWGGRNDCVFWDSRQTNSHECVSAGPCLRPSWWETGPPLIAESPDYPWELRALTIPVFLARTLSFVAPPWPTFGLFPRRGRRANWG